MPIDREDLPSTLKRSPEKVQAAYAGTLDSAEETYEGDPERAHRAAWASVKHIAEKQGDHWELKDEPGPSDAQAEQSRTDAAVEDPKPTAGGVDANKTKDELYADAQAAGIEGRSAMAKDELVEALQRHNDRETARARER